MVNRAHGKSHGRGSMNVSGPHNRPGKRDVAREGGVGGKKRKPSVPRADKELYSKQQSLARAQVSAGASARVKPQDNAKGLGISLTDNRLIRTLTTHWRDVSFVVVGTSLAAVGAIVTLSTVFFWLGVVLTVAGALMMLVGVASMGRNSEMVHNLFVAEKKTEEVKDEAQHLQELVGDAAGDVKDIEEMVRQDAIRLEAEAEALRQAQQAAEAMKQRQAEMSAKIDELEFMMSEVREHNVAIEYLTGCIQRVTSDLQSTAKAISELHASIQGANGDVFEMARALHASLREKVAHLEQLRLNQEAPSEADIKDFQKAIQMIESILAALEDEQAEVIGLEEKHLKMIGQFSVLEHMIENLQRHHLGIRGIMERAHEKRSEIRRVLDDNKSFVVVFDDALGAIDNQISEFAENDSRMGDRIQHLNGVIRDIDTGIGVIQVKAEEAAVAVRKAKKAAGVGYVETLKRLGLVGVVGLGAIAASPVVGVAAGLGAVVYWELDHVRTGLGVICGALPLKRWNPFS